MFFFLVQFSDAEGIGLGHQNWFFSVYGKVLFSAFSAIPNNRVNTLIYFGKKFPLHALIGVLHGEKVKQKWGKYNALNFYAESQFLGMAISLSFSKLA